MKLSSHAGLIIGMLVQIIRVSNEEAIASMQNFKAGLSKALNSREDSLRSGIWPHMCLSSSSKAQVCTQGMQDKLQLTASCQAIPVQMP